MDLAEQRLVALIVYRLIHTFLLRSRRLQLTVDFLPAPLQGAAFVVVGEELSGTDLYPRDEQSNAAAVADDHLTPSIAVSFRSLAISSGML